MPESFISSNQQLKIMKTKLLNRSTIASVCYYSGLIFLLGYIRKFSGKSLPLFLMGHRVLQESNNLSGIDRMALITGHAITDIELERRLRYVMRFWKVGDPKELSKWTNYGNKFYLTFDDGYIDNVSIAGPVLNRLKIKAIIFVVAELMKFPKRLPWWDYWGDARNGTTKDDVNKYMSRCMDMKKTSQGLSRDKPMPYIETGEDRIYLSLSEVKSLSEKNIFYIGNHTANHANLIELSNHEIKCDLADGSSDIKDLPNYIPLLAYPFGYHNEKVISAVKKQNNISIAFATGNGKNGDRFLQKRININMYPFCYFAAECVGLFDVLSYIKQKLSNI